MVDSARAPNPRRFLLVAMGTRGDVQPMLALGLALRERGHTATLAAPPNLQAFVESTGLPFLGVGQDYEKLTREMGTNSMKSLPVLLRQFEIQWKALAPLASQADAILCAALVMVGRELAAHAGLPHRYVALSAGMLRSDEYSSPFFPWQGLPRWANRLTWWANDSLANLSFLKETNRLRARLGFRPTSDSWRNVLGEEVIVASEPSLGRVPADARVRTHQTGAWLLPEREALPEEVERFLQAGPPPVYIGFGSMQGNDRGRGARAISEALRATGLRAVVSRGWEGLVVDGGPQVLAVDALPHGKLFPRCAAVVHHGGAGTTTAVARAGVPQVVVPHIADQYYQAVNVVRAGLSPATLPRNKLRAGPLAKALRACVEDGALRERARTFAQGMIQYGLAQAVQLVEMLPGTSPPVL